MSNAIDNLMKEHRRIEAFLFRLSQFSGGPPELLESLEFLTEYVDALHHEKEEEILFHTMESHGFARQMGPLAVMLAEHQMGRRLVSELKSYAARPTWAEIDHSAVRHLILEYTQLLQQHIMKEDRILYPMARGNIPPEAMASVDRECALRDEANIARRRELEALVPDELMASTPASSCGGFG